MSEIISIPIIELMEKTERWLLDHDYKKSTIGVYKATWNKFRVFSASPFYDCDTAKKFLFRYFGIDENAVVQKCDKRMQQARRHMDVLDEYKERKINDAGVAFFDLNGLKMINDKKGHKAGDTYICLAAGTFIKKFPENAYRIGGDEFVIIMLDVNKAVFECEVHKLQEEMQKKGVSISMGYLWRKSVDDMVDMLNEADRLMYEEKKHYYQSNKA